MKSAQIYHNRFELNAQLDSGFILPQLTTGLTKQEIEFILDKPVGVPSIKNDDLERYEVEVYPDFWLILLLDKHNVCFEIKIDIDDNPAMLFILNAGGEKVIVNSQTSLVEMVEHLAALSIPCSFDSKRIHDQTLCIKIGSGIRFYFAFGDKTADDFGFFAITSILEDHPLQRR